ncbi:hypothetical protein P3X46_023289 [Hevea brasiliensis]|uniref:DUF4005 domain-containing protein n=1 Tax=Hevea brasiliensis TaxID=3981 RepID=A0ABQ9LAG4_HEVBR|nr:protein IQ-DOMAIN 31 [Hevea brasiliensis]XP_057988438.1 protein IQ-DOMAIN 31 [Hevea brasiliensis]XP_057988439.1 protein IQ-DOMAIN 31 [Hevea brasiliensis]KAJ9163640.1 hypothetical protein P3X46_023289 [Hevea brasiliensis]KAJ9163641.1 hypothetical protein P3X46_023289 [Hevea brasiliensis]
MGKSPGRWIKTVLFGKKSYKSHTAKGRERTANEREVLVSAKASEADSISVPPVISHPTPVITVHSERQLELESQETADSPHNGGILLPGNQEVDLQGSTNQATLSDAEKIRQEKAATLVQAAFRGFLARRAFWALKGIIRLQALIRGHLVRRQAVATLCCVLGIVKMQALARGIKVRNSDRGRHVLKKCGMVKPLGKLEDPNGANVSIQKARLSANAFVHKLVASLSTVMPLNLYYDSAEPNSVSNWLERWSASRFWKPIPQPKKISCPKTQRKQVNGHMPEAETGRPKFSVRRVPAANFDNTSVQAPSESEKPKRNRRKASSHATDTSQENPQNELEKVKRNLRKVHNPIIDCSVQSEVDIEKPKQGLEIVSGTSGDNLLGQNMNNSGEKMKKEATLATHKLPDMVKNEQTLIAPKLPDAETTPEPLGLKEASELHGDQTVVESMPSVENGGKDENNSGTNGELSHKEDPTINENHKFSRKASSLVKQECAENGLQSGPALPSYMAATESAKAKLRAQGSPRFSQDGAEKNILARRHSLPSSANSKISSQSPRTRTVHSGGKGGSKSDRSLLSSREGNAKATQAEWRR